MANRSPIPSNALLSLVLLWLVSLAIARRCDRSVTVYTWNYCMECSVNRFHRCPNRYRTETSGEGIQRCSYLLNFGANFGHITVPGCQHSCSQRITRRECCGGFWGQDCQGRKCLLFSLFSCGIKGFCGTNFNSVLRLPHEFFQLLCLAFMSLR